MCHALCAFLPALSLSGENVFVEGGIWKSYELISGGNSLPHLYSPPHSCGWVMVVMAWVERERPLPASSRCGPGDSFQLPDNLVHACDPLTPHASCYQLRLTCTLSDAIISLLRGYWQGDFKGQVYSPCSFRFEQNPRLLKNETFDITYSPSCHSKPVCCTFFWGETQAQESSRIFIKGDLLCKNHFYKVFEHSCVAAVCENNQPVMVKIHPLVFL